MKSLAALLTAVALLPVAVARPADRHVAADASVRLDAPADGPGRRIPSHFVGLSVEWSLVERYMGRAARPAFANLLRNLRTGVLRIGGISQDIMPFARGAADTNRVVTPPDVAAVRATLDAADTAPSSGAPGWGVILGTAMVPRSAARPWVGRGNARAFVRHGVLPAFSGHARRFVAGVELGNEPDVSYRWNARRYLRDLASFSAPDVVGPFAVVGPNTTEPIAPWAAARRRRAAARSFWARPRTLGTLAAASAATAPPFGRFATSHFYPVARRCGMDAYRCATIARLLSDERMANFGHQIHARAQAAARHGLGYRVEEMNSASGRGVQGVSDTAASALWALEAMFTAACPQPPNAPGANADCHTGAIGVNFHNAEVRRFFHPEDGNAHYNAVRYDASAPVAAPAAAPQYYALLLFARFAQGATGLRPVAVDAHRPTGGEVTAWRMEDEGGARRLFLLNRSRRAATVAVAAAATSFELHRMTPHDPAGAGRTLDAPAVRIDGRAVSPDGTWPGFRPEAGVIDGARLDVTLGAGEAAVVTLRA
jgi:hypothetical protein